MDRLWYFQFGSDGFCWQSCELPIYCLIFLLFVIAEFTYARIVYCQMTAMEVNGSHLWDIVSGIYMVTVFFYVYIGFSFFLEFWWTEHDTSVILMVVCCQYVGGMISLYILIFSKSLSAWFCVFSLTEDCIVYILDPFIWILEFTLMWIYWM